MERAFLHTFRLLLPSQTTEERLLARQRQKVLQLSLHRRPRFCTGRHMFFREIMALAEEKKRLGAMPKTAMQLPNVIMKRHSAQCDKLPPNKKLKFELEPGFHFV